MRTDSPLIGRWRAVLSLCALAATLAGLPQRAATQPLTAASMSAPELAQLEAINAYRQAKGHAAWSPDPGLATVARAHSQAMAQHGRFSHTGFRRRAEATGSALCVENLLHGTVAPRRAVLLWTASDLHRSNLLEPGAHYAGIGMAGTYVTLLACATPTPASAVAQPGLSERDAGPP